MAKDKVVEEGMVWAIIGYIWILFLVPLLAKKDNKFALYHAKQGMMLFIVWVVFFVATLIVGWVPIIGLLLSALMWIVLLVLFVIGIINAATGKYAPLPVVGKTAEKWKI